MANGGFIDGGGGGLIDGGGGGFREEDHPRGPGGKFASKGGSAGGSHGGLGFPAREARLGSAGGNEKTPEIHEFERLTRELGIPEVDFGTSVHVARWAYRGLKEGHNAGREMPSAVRVDPHLEAVAQVDPKTLALTINPRQPDFQSQGAAKVEARAAGRRKLTSTRHEHHFIRHELTHVAHARALGAAQVIAYNDPKWSDAVGGAEALSLAETVSTRATYSPAEFVAEVYAGHLGEVNYPEPVLQLYQRYGGPKLPARNSQE
jgi:hypothetical protein